MDGKPAVLNFLKEHSEVIPVLLEAVDQIRLLFPYEELQLERIVDPEFGGDQLCISILTTLDGNEAFRRLNQLDDNYWLQATDQVDSLFVITVECI